MLNYFSNVLEQSQMNHDVVFTFISAQCELYVTNQNEVYDVMQDAINR